MYNLTVWYPVAHMYIYLIYDLMMGTRLVLHSYFGTIIVHDYCNLLLGCHTERKKQLREIYTAAQALKKTVATS